MKSIHYISRTIILLVLVLCSACTTGGQRSVNAKPTILKLSHEVIDFGKVKINTEVTTDLLVTNVGQTALTIYRVNTSCGCTEVEWDKKPVRPSKSSIIKVNYKDKYPGYIHKTITIHANLEKPITLELKGELVE